MLNCEFNSDNYFFEIDILSYYTYAQSSRLKFNSRSYPKINLSKNLQIFFRYRKAILQIKYKRTNFSESKNAHLIIKFIFINIVEKL